MMKYDHFNCRSCLWNKNRTCFAFHYTTRTQFMSQLNAAATQSNIFLFCLYEMIKFATLTDAGGMKQNTITINYLLH